MSLSGFSASGGVVTWKVSLSKGIAKNSALYEVSEMLGLSRVNTEDFLGYYHVPLAVIDEADLDREAALLEAATEKPPP
jgi:hypothetical protein